VEGIIVTTKRAEARLKLIKAVPLMKYVHSLEFKQRLQWLSEGMLRNHLQGIRYYTPDEAEIRAYKEYKEALK
jgi:hypothetical protein